MTDRRECPTSTIKPLIFRTTSKSSEATTSIRSFSTDATLTSAPAAAQSSADSDFIASLYALEDKSPQLLKSSSLTAPADFSIEVRSWKVPMFKYYEVPSPLPTLARGLFTREIRNDSQEEGKASKTYQIVARGYDKFFCVGEVPWTMVGFLFYLLCFLFVIDYISQWSSLEAHTSVPYTLSPKLNGRIILIAALTPSKLVITSKRSIGSFYTREASHTEAGERWLRKHLENKGKTKADLARTLWGSNLTAVTEVFFKKKTYLQTFIIYQTFISYGMIPSMNSFSAVS